MKTIFFGCAKAVSAKNDSSKLKTDLIAMSQFVLDDRGIRMVQSIAKKFQAFDSDFFIAGFDAAPNGGGAGDNFDIGRKRFDDDVAVVTDIVKGFCNGGPVCVIAAGRTAIAAAGVEVAEMRTGAANGGGGRFLLDIHVESVEKNFKRRAADIFDHLEGLIAGVDKIGFVAVEWFEADLLGTLSCAVAQRTEIFDDRAPLAFVFGNGDGVGASDGRIEWTNHGWAIQLSHLIENAQDVV